MSRTTEIVDRISELMRTFSAWQQQPGSLDIAPSSSLAAAIRAAIACVANGDTPSMLVPLCGKVAILEERWTAYCDGDCRPKTKEPMPYFYAAFRELGTELMAAMRLVQDERTPVYPVAHFVKQGLSPSQIAGQYSAFDESLGYQVGPFHQMGRVVEEWVHEEIATPGARLKPEFVHPRDEVEKQQRERQMRRDVESVESVLDVSKSEAIGKIKPKPTRETVLQLLAEKLFPKQIMLDYDITEAEIDAIALGAGVAVEAVPTAQPQAEPQSETPATPSTESVSDRVKARTAAILAERPEATSTEIAETLSDELGQVIKPASVNAIMTNIKRRQQQS